jgi:uncharacterized integral membrane protein
MARRERTGPVAPLRDVRRTKASALWVTTAVAVLLLLLLGIFIAQNSQSVEVHFLGADGSVSLALGLLFSALAGAGVVLLAGAVRIVQLRLAGRRHLRGHTARGAATAAPPESAGAAPRGDVQPVDAERRADDTRP